MKLALLEHTLHTRLGWRLKIAMLAAMAALSLYATANDKSFDKQSCTYKGKKLYGKIQIVTSFPDIKVQEVTSFPDIKVQEVTSFPDVKVEKVKAFPDKCGQWQIVNAFPDTKVQIVTSFPDVKVQYVTAFPGMP